MSSIPDRPQLGVFALVSYLTDPLGSFLTDLRQSLPGDETPQPHITILPPRPLTQPLEAASLEAKKTLEGFAHFEVKLGGVKLFPETNILYVEVASGSRCLQKLHALLNKGGLYHDERFEYSPHVTISGPCSGVDVESGRSQAEQTWKNSGLSFEFSVTDVVFLWQPEGTDEKHWQRLWSYRLADPNERAAAEAATLS